MATSKKSAKVRGPTRGRQRVRVFFHKRGQDPESAWCTSLPARNQYRLDNILFLHASPVYGDVVEAVEIERFDGQLASKRIVRKGGRFAMIIDYADARRSTRPRRRQFRMQPPVRTAPRGSPPLRSS